jgi:hypothetical protein
VRVWNGPAGGWGPVLGWVGGTLLGPEGSGAVTGPGWVLWVSARRGGGLLVFLVVVWLLDSGREHLL